MLMPPKRALNDRLRYSYKRQAEEKAPPLTCCVAIYGKEKMECSELKNTPTPSANAP